MEIQNQSGPGPRSRRAQDIDLAFDPTRSNREAIRKTIERLESTATTRAGGGDADRIGPRAEPRDRVDVSEQGRRLAAAQDDPAAAQERVDELRRRYAEGRLVTGEKIELAAEKMLEMGSFGGAAKLLDE